MRGAGILKGFNVATSNPTYTAQCIFCRNVSIPKECFVAGLTFKWTCNVCGLRNRADLSDFGMVKLLESPLRVIVGAFDDDYLPSGRPLTEMDITYYLYKAGKTDYLVSYLTGA